MGFDRPEFFCAIGGTSGEEETVRRYLQLWLNQIALIVHLNEQGLLTRSQWHSLEVDIECLFETSELKNLWSEFRPFYLASLRSFLDGKVAASGDFRCVNEMIDLKVENLCGNFLEYGEGDSHVGFAFRGCQCTVCFSSRNVSLHGDVAVIGGDSSRAGSV
jgi:hypothetical protein